MENKILLRVGGTKHAIWQLENSVASELSNPTQALKECAHFLLVDEDRIDDDHLLFIMTLGLRWKDLSLWGKATRMYLRTSSFKRDPEKFDWDEILEAWTTFGFEALHSS